MAPPYKVLPQKFSLCRHCARSQFACRARFGDLEPPSAHILSSQLVFFKRQVAPVHRHGPRWSRSRYQAQHLLVLPLRVDCGCQLALSLGSRQISLMLLLRVDPPRRGKIIPMPRRLLPRSGRCGPWSQPPGPCRRSSRSAGTVPAPSSRAEPASATSSPQAPTSYPRSLFFLNGRWPPCTGVRTGAALASTCTRISRWLPVYPPIAAQLHSSTALAVLPMPQKNEAV